MLLVKSSDFFCFLTCILPYYLAHESFKEFWNNGHFENMTADFLRRCQNTLWQTDYAFPGMIFFFLLVYPNNILTY